MASIITGLVVLAVLWFASNQKQAIVSAEVNSVQKSPQNESAIAPVNQTTLEARKTAIASVTVRQPDAAAAINELSKSIDMVELLHTARRSSDISVQEFAVDAPASLCSSLQFTRNNGFSPIVEAGRAKLGDVIKTLLPMSSAEFKMASGACQNYAQEGVLRDELAKELANGASPVMAAKQAFRGKYPSDEGQNESVSAALARVLANDSGAVAGMYLLKNALAISLQPSVASELPESLRADAVPLTVVAVEIGACRAGLACEKGSIARSAVCAKYGECSSPDVEAAYRRLFALYDVPFEYVDRPALRFQRAIQSKDVSALVNRG